MPGAIWKPVPNHGGAMTNHYGLVLHVQQGNNSLQGWFSNPSSDASSTWWVSKSGVIEQYVDSDIQAWAQSQGNATFNSVETEGYDSDYLTDAQVEALARVYVWGNDEYGWPFHLSKTTTDKGFAWHGLGGASWGNHPSCPGDKRKSQMSAVIQLAQGTPPIPPPIKPTPVAPAMHVDYFGPAYGHNYQAADVKTWQSQMAKRGWSISADQIYGPQSYDVCIAFQREKGLSVDGLVGPITWDASWTYPVT
jgi:hypothetical protein